MNDKPTDAAAVVVPRTHRDALRANVAIIADAVAASGITIVRATYSGSGDSGDQYEVSVEPEDAELPNAMLALWSVAYDGAATHVERSLHDAIELTADLALEVTGNSNYADGNGGGGDLIIDVQASSARLDHYDIVEEHEESSHAFEPHDEAVAVLKFQRDGRRAESLDALQKAVEALG